MPTTFTPHLLDLVADAALKSFWRRNALRTFLRRCGIAESYLATWNSTEESKREFLDRLFPTIESSSAGSKVLSKISRALSEKTSFPDLEGWEDSKEKIKQARAAVDALKQYLKKEEENAIEEHDREQMRQRAHAMQQQTIQQRATLDKLRARLDLLATQIGTQQAGYDFETWFYDLLDYFEVLCRRPYVTNGRQIDGSITVDGTTYLIELRFRREQADGPDVDVFYRKVQDKADNTMGIMVSMSGYSSVAVTSASGPRTPLLIFDYAHLYFLLTGSITFAELVNRLRRHSSQTGEAYLPVKDFGG